MRNIKISFTNGDTLDLMCYSPTIKEKSSETIVFKWNNLMPITEDDPEMIVVSKRNINYITYDTDNKGE